MTTTLPLNRELSKRCILSRHTVTIAKAFSKPITVVSRQFRIRKSCQVPKLSIEKWRFSICDFLIGFPLKLHFGEPTPNLNLTQENNIEYRLKCCKCVIQLQEIFLTSQIVNIFFCGKWRLLSKNIYAGKRTCAVIIITSMLHPLGKIYRDHKKS